MATPLQRAFVEVDNHIPAREPKWCGKHPDKPAMQHHAGIGYCRDCKDAAKAAARKGK